MRRRFFLFLDSTGFAGGADPLYIVMAGFAPDAEIVNFFPQFQHLITISSLICGHLLAVSVEECVADLFFQGHCILSYYIFVR